MWRLLLALFATVGLALIMLAAEPVLRPLARLVRGLLTGLAAVLGIAGIGIAVAGITEEAWWAAVVGGLILAVALRLGWALRRPRRPRLRSEPRHVPLVEAGPGDHWSRFDASLDRVGRQQARRSSKAIAGFLAERDSPSLTAEHHSLLLSCEKRVPELIQTCVERCRNASQRERDRYIDETLARLQQIGVEAERARREVREADDRRLEVLHRYFDGVAGPGERRPD